MLRLRKSLLLLLPYTLLVGCSTVPKGSDKLFSLPYENHAKQLQITANWNFNGKIALINANKVTQANIEWSQSHDEFNIQLSGPLKLESVALRGNSKSVNLTENGKITNTAESAEQLMQQNLGWELPITGLKYWILGVPKPNVAIEHKSLDNYGLIQELKQQGWIIRYNNYLVFNKVRLPNKILLERKHGNSTIRVKFAIRYWEI